MLPDDRARTRLVGDALAQDAPERSLFVLRHAMTNLLEVTTGLTRLPRVPFRLFYALLGRRAARDRAETYFNPLHALEFRPEFDRITKAQMLELIRSVPGEQARRLVALTLLSLFRMLRYLTLVESVASEPTDTPRRSAAVVYLVLSVLRSDARALSGYLRSRAGPLLAEGFDAEVFRMSSIEIAAEYERLLARGHELRDVKATLEGVAANLRLEMRRAFERDFPALDSAPSLDELRTSVAAASRRTCGPRCRTRSCSSAARSARGSTRAASSTTRRRDAALSERLAARRVDVRPDRPRVRGQGALGDAGGAGALGRRLAARLRARVHGLLPRHGLPAAARRTTRASTPSSRR